MLARCNDYRLYVLSFGALLVGCTSVAPPQSPSPLPTSATAGDTTIVAIAPTGGSHNLWQFSGIEQATGAVCAAKHAVRDHFLSKLGMRFPGLEPTPAIKLITDPANLSDDAPPTVQAAAEVKMKEDQAAQKIKGIRYLATIGCGGCYDGVEDALLASLEDCTEEVRYETVLAIRKSTGKECSFCNSRACCSEKVQTKLLKMITMENGCYPEPSARVRRQARLALRQCGPVVPVLEEEGDAEEGEGGNESGPEAVAPPESLDEEEETPPALPTPEALSMHTFELTPVDHAVRPW